MMSPSQQQSLAGRQQASALQTCMKTCLFLLYFSPICNIERYKVKYVDTTDLTFLLCLFSILLCFAGIFVIDPTASCLSDCQFRVNSSCHILSLWPIRQIRSLTLQW